MGARLAGILVREWPFVVDDAGMYLRKTQRRNADGSVVRYLQLASNRRINGTTQAEVLVNLGRQDKLDVAALRRLVASVDRYLGDEGDAAGGLGAGAGPLSVEESRPSGAIWLLDQVWRSLDIDATLARVLGPRRFRTDVERVIFALVANRAVAPSSKLAAAEWVTHSVVVPGLACMDKDQAMRAEDLLVTADAQGEVPRRCSSLRLTSSTWRSTWSSSTPPAPTSNETAKRTRARTVPEGCAGSGIPKTIAVICRRS